MYPVPAAPEGRLDGQRFFRADERDFFYVTDGKVDGYTGSRDDAWRAAADYALAEGITEISEMSTKRLNDYVGPGVFGSAVLVTTHPLTRTSTEAVTLTLTLEELILLDEALDSYEYWEHRDQLPHDSGAVTIIDHDDFLQQRVDGLVADEEEVDEAWGAVKAARELARKLFVARTEVQDSSNEGRLKAALEHLATPNHAARANGQDARDMAAYASNALKTVYGEGEA